MDLANRTKIGEVDMEGVNSPQRGWFKLGFGGNLLPYYQISMTHSLGNLPPTVFREQLLAGKNSTLELSA